MPHFRILETWRLSAAILVMIWHYLRYAPGGAVTATEALYRLLPLMEMFFMISGFLIMLRYSDTLFSQPGGLRRFIVRRFTRLYPLYFATLVFFSAVAVAVHLGLVKTNWPGRYDLSLLPANLLLLQGWGVTDTLTFNYVGWTLSAEWFCYLTFPIIVLVAARYGMGGLALLAFASILALELLVVFDVMPFDTWFKADTWGAYRAFADFCLGALVALAVKASPRARIGHLAAWTIFGLALAAMATLQSSYLVLALLAASIYAAAIAEIGDPRGSLWLRPLGPLGAVSFGIYMIHPVMETVFFSIAWKLMLDPLVEDGFYVYWLLPMLATIAAALASARWFEGPAASWLNRRLDPRGLAARSPA